MSKKIIINDLGALVSLFCGLALLSQPPPRTSLTSLSVVGMNG